MNRIESDNYRTKDGKAYFSFSFFEEEEFFTIDVTFVSTPIVLAEKADYCISSKRGGFTITSVHKARDLFTAKLIAGQWAEDLWTEYLSKATSKKLNIDFLKKDKK